MKRKVTDNFLMRENCNKAKCGTCIFRTDGKQLKISEERMNEIRTYLGTGQSSHICHKTEKTCYGGLEYTAMIYNRMGLIPEPTVDSLLDTAAKHLKAEKTDL